nr:Chain B, LYS-ASP-LYS-PRO-PRO-ARG [synthetic construct]8PFE_D Chain D, LYS-ASP-LYS-PRO-PRO-ARG [synthetic construct]
KDKPPR